MIVPILSTSLELSPSEIGATGTAVFMAGWAAWERWRNSRTKEGMAIAAQSTELASVWQKQAEAYKANYDRIYDEYNHYREEVHKKASEDQVLVANLNERIINLSAKTDVTPFIEFQKGQATINQNLIKTQSDILAVLEKVLDKLDITNHKTESHE